MIPAQLRLLAGVTGVVALILLGAWLADIDCERRIAEIERDQQTARAQGAEQAITRAEDLAAKDEANLAGVAQDAQASRTTFTTIQRGISNVAVDRPGTVFVPVELNRLWQCADRAANPGAAPCEAGGVHGALRDDRGLHTDHAGGLAVGEGSDRGPHAQDGGVPRVLASAGLSGSVD